jgi:adenylate cyclase
MAKLVMEHGGVIDDYFGDSIKANFGVPLPRTGEDAISRDAVAAVNCALAMESELKSLNALWRQQNLPGVQMRIGMYTGPIVAGSLGSAQRLKYTTVGDTVNIASRLESFDKDLAATGFFLDSPCRILIGETTLRYVSDQFETRSVGETPLRGKDKEITIYRVVGRQRKYQRRDEESIFP